MTLIERVEKLAQEVRPNLNPKDINEIGGWATTFAACREYSGILRGIRSTQFYIKSIVLSDNNESEIEFREHFESARRLSAAITSWKTTLKETK